MFWIIAWLLSAVAWFTVTIIYGWFFWLSPISMFLVIVNIIPLIYFVLAPRNICFTLINEGWAKLVGKGSSYHKTITSSKDYIIEDNGNVVFLGGLDSTLLDGKFIWILNKEVVAKNTAGAKKYQCRFLFGGLRFYGIFPFLEILRYKFHWSHLHEDGSIACHDEVTDDVLLKTDLYVVDLPLTSKKSTQDIDGVSLGVSVVLPIRIANVYEAFYIYRRWLSLVNGTVESSLRRFIARYRYKEDLIDMVAGEGIEDRQAKKGVISDDIKVAAGADLREQYWKELSARIHEVAAREGSLVVEEFGKIFAFGIEIQKTGYGILNIEPSEEYRKLTTAKYEADRKKEVVVIGAKAQKRARIIEAEGEKDAMVKETSGTLIAALAEGYGKTEKEIQEKVYGKNGSTKLSEEFRKAVIDLIERRIAAKSGGLFDERVSGSSLFQGATASLMPLLAKAFSSEKQSSSNQDSSEEEN